MYSTAISFLCREFIAIINFFFSDNIRDMTDAVLLAQKRVEEEENPEKMAMFNDVHVRQIVSDLFVGKK